MSQLRPMKFNRRIYSADRRFDYVEKAGGRSGRARSGRENRERRVYDRI